MARLPLACFSFVGVVILAMYVAGLMISLFGPARGPNLSVVAFILMMLYVVTISVWHRYSSSSIVASTRWKRVLKPMAFVCFLLFGICFIILAFFPGVADGSTPVFETRPNYQLVSHGEYTRVSRLEYVLAGTAFTLGWHTMGMGFTVCVIYTALYRVDFIQDVDKRK
jgi:ABC-type transport system involved in multi-copper enzyme maturation permease subunit